ncbi:MAG: hypothetical protein AB2693_32445 [Candidatus Thiodiazotropha sp.]
MGLFIIFIGKCLEISAQIDKLNSYAVTQYYFPILNADRMRIEQVEETKGLFIKNWELQGKLKHTYMESPWFFRPGKMK